MPTFDKELDASGLTCPMPIMKTKKMLQTLAAGQILHLIATDPGTKSDIPALLGKTGDQIIESSIVDKKFHFYIRKTS
ncbi:MAG: sulfurtransferase TusA family protein [Sulfuricaulis sp.]|nr:sulfurtransferase TusA family protein [Sulfuricaulis sp.]